MKKIRYWVVRLFLSYEEMLLLGEAVDRRIDVLERYRVCEKTADVVGVDDDLKVLLSLKGGVCLSGDKK